MTTSRKKKLARQYNASLGRSMALYRVWLSESELLPVEFEADSAEEARRKIEAHIYEGTLWKETSIEMSEGCLEVHSVERVE